MNVIIIYVTSYCIIRLYYYLKNVYLAKWEAQKQFSFGVVTDWETIITHVLKPLL